MPYPVNIRVDFSVRVCGYVVDNLLCVLVKGKFTKFLDTLFHDTSLNRLREELYASQFVLIAPPP